MQFVRFTLLSSLFTTGTTVGKSKLPACKGSNTTKWSYCIGTETYANGDKYVGEWKGVKRYGQGTATFANGGKYVGKYNDDKFNG